MRIFFGAPFTKHLTKGNGQLHKSKKTLIEKIVELLGEQGHYVRNAHIREEFGKKLLNPKTCTELDFEEVKKCDLFIALPDDPPSGGVHVELGWASALNKKILLLLKNKGEYSPLITGLNVIGGVEKIYFRNQMDLLEKIKKVL